MFQIRYRVPGIIAALVLFHSTLAGAQAQMPPGMGGGQAGSGMPDARMMSGIPMPVDDLPDGTIAVRVVRGEIANVIKGQLVELSVDGKARSATTDDNGRAQFTGVPAGANLQATATVGGERLDSQAFPMPAKGGVRMLLVATGGTGGPPADPNAKPVPGSVSFGGDTRVVVEFEDDTLTVFYLLDIVNNSSTPISTTSPIVLDLPAGAMSPSLMEGSSPQAEVKGPRLTITGPFKPGRTSAQVAFQLPPAGDSRVIEQTFPIGVDAFSVIVQKVGDSTVRSSLLSGLRDVTADGKPYTMASGVPLPAGRTIKLELSGLPHRETWPRNLAYALAVLILGAGAWLVMGAGQGGGVPAQARQRELEATRERLFGELTRLEDASRSRGDNKADGGRRATLMAELERVYAELDTLAHAGGDRGAAA